MFGIVASFLINLFLLRSINNKESTTGSDKEPQPSEYTESNVNQIGGAIPVVLGRAMIKNPLVSYYGDFDYKPYTEEYGMHSEYDAASNLWPILLGILGFLVPPVTHKADKTMKLDDPAVSTSGGSGQVDNPTVSGTVKDDINGKRFDVLVAMIIDLLIKMLLNLFNKHEGRTTIQKGFFYYLGWQHIICWTGENIGVKTLWMNVYDSEAEQNVVSGVWSGTATRVSNPGGVAVHIDDDQMFGGPDEGGGFIGDVNIYFGGDGQSKDPWMVTQMSTNPTIPASLVGLTPRYPMYVTCVVPKAYIGKQATIPEMWFEITNYPNNLGFPPIGEDLNPAEAIYEILTNKDWGCNYSGDRIDVDSIISLGHRCAAEGIGISILMNQSGQAKEFIDNIMSHINGIHFDSPVTGKLTFKLIREDFFGYSTELRRYDVANCVSCEFSRLDWSEVMTTVSVKFTDVDNKYATGELMVYDIANRKITGSYTEKQVDGTYFTRPENARWLAQVQLLSAGYPLAMINLETNRYGYNVLKGEPIIVTWEPYGIKEQIFRVIDVDYGTLTNNIIKISAVEDVFSFEKTAYNYSNAPQWTEPEKRPFDIARYKYYEEPYELTFSLDTYLYAYAAQPSVHTIRWDVWRNVSGGYSNTAQSTIWSIVGKPVYGYTEGYDYDYLGFEFSAIGIGSDTGLDNKMTLISSDPSSYNQFSRRNLVIIDDEIISYNHIDKLPSGNYALRGVIRGVYDTLPKQHTTESIMYFIDYRLNVAGSGIVATEGNTSAEELELKTASATETQPFDILDLENFHTKRRSEQPSVMANLKMGADKGTETNYSYGLPVSRMLSYDILFTFLGRNKFNYNRIIEQTNTTVIDVSNLVKNVIQIDCNGENLEYMFDSRDASDTVNIENMRLKWTDFCKDMGNKVSQINSCVIRIMTYDTSRNLYSYNNYEKTFNWVIPRMVGVVSDFTSAQAYANTLVQPALNNIRVPATPVSPQMILTFEDCALIFEGTAIASGGIIGQDGNRYNLSTTAYRIDGYTSAGAAIIHRITIDNEYVFRSNFNILVGNYDDYYRLRLGTYIPYTPY